MRDFSGLGWASVSLFLGSFLMGTPEPSGVSLVVCGPACILSPKRQGLTPARGSVIEGDFKGGLPNHPLWGLFYSHPQSSLVGVGCGVRAGLFLMFIRGLDQSCPGRKSRWLSGPRAAEEVDGLWASKEKFAPLSAHCRLCQEAVLKRSLCRALPFGSCSGDGVCEVRVRAGP